MTDPTDAVPRFGLQLAGVSVLTPPDSPAEFVAATPVYPLPMAPRRIRGVTQIHGHPVLVFDAALAAPTLLPVLSQRALLVLERQPDAVAILTDEPPQPVFVRAAAPEQARPDVVFAAALRDPLVCDQAGALQTWWQADFDQFFELLANDR